MAKELLLLSWTMWKPNTARQTATQRKKQMRTDSALLITQTSLLTDYLSFFPFW